MSQVAALGKEQLDILIGQLLEKIKSTSALIITEEDFGSKGAWNEFLLSIIQDNSDPELATRAVTVAMLTELLSFANYSTLEVVKGYAINAVVKNPVPNSIYLLKNPEDETKNTLWAYDDTGVGNWVPLTKNVEIPEINVINTISPEAVQNVISHVNRGTSDYTASTNAKGDDIINVTALTKILIGLAGTQTVQIPYSEGRGRLISKVVAKPSLNTLYLYQESTDENDWSVYTVATVTVDSLEKFVWIKISGEAKEGSSVVDVNLANYWSKDELVPLTEEEIISIVNEAAAKAGF